MYTTYYLPERLDTNNSLAVEKEILTQLGEKNYLILDFSNCFYISSSGLRILVKTKKDLIHKQGDLFITHLQATVKSVLEMAGMIAFLSIKASNEEAENAIQSLIQCHSTIPSQFYDNNHSFFFKKHTDEAISLVNWDEPTLASYEELQFAVGEGTPADDIQNTHSYKPFVATGQCVGFDDPNAMNNTDYRVSILPSKSGLYIRRAFSFGHTSIGTLECVQSQTIQELLHTIEVFRTNYYKNTYSSFLCIIIEKRKAVPAVNIVYQDEKEGLSGGTFLLSKWHDNEVEKNLCKIITQNLTIENIEDYQPIDSKRIIENAACELFFASQTTHYTDTRLDIETDTKEPLDLYKAFLARRIYTDSAKIILHKLHGGFSAQTFQVNSFDKCGRKLRPTVMKIASKAMIERESLNCIHHAQPYILNNCAQVLGTEFFGETGALRYNFVGIGGKNSQLKWLTDYYHKEPFEILEPILNKIFIQILQPWYGQAITDHLKPFSDHDPSLTFFPHIFDEAQKVLGISSDEPLIYIKELQRKIRNPYWYLKHIFPTQRDWEINYYSCICHGDLNMQNILIDENKNIYLIDFSETKVRSAISDFARLESIFLIDNLNCSSEKEYKDTLAFLTSLYEHMQSINPNELNNCCYKGENALFFNKNIRLTQKIRSFALNYVKENKNPLPYYFALLEWILPIVCYTNVNPISKRVSMIISGILCEKIIHLVQ